MVKTLICILVIYSFWNQGMAQQVADKDSQDEGLISRFIYNEKVALKLDYFGELVLHPGLTFGVEYSLLKKEWVNVHWDTELGGFWHRWNNSSFIFKSSVGTRLPIWSMFVDFNLGAGYMHSFSAGKIYHRATDGGVEKSSNWGHSHFMPTFSVLFGYDGTRKHNLPFTIHIGAETYLQSSFNHIFLPHAAAKLGITYKFRKK